MNQDPHYREPAGPECPLRHPTETPTLARQFAVGSCAALGAALGPIVGRASGWNDLASVSVFAFCGVVASLSFIPWLVTGPHSGSNTERSPRPVLWRRLSWKRALPTMVGVLGFGTVCTILGFGAYQGSLAANTAPSTPSAQERRRAADERICQRVGMRYLMRDDDTLLCGNDRGRGAEVLSFETDQPGGGIEVTRSKP